jgi:hypothetical protein
MHTDINGQNMIDLLTSSRSKQDENYSLYIIDQHIPMEVFRKQLIDNISQNTVSLIGSSIQLD